MPINLTCPEKPAQLAPIQPSPQYLNLHGCCSLYLGDRLEFLHSPHVGRLGEKADPRPALSPRLESIHFHVGKRK